MIYLKRRLIESRPLTRTPAPILDGRQGLTGDWLRFLSGLLTADGTLGIYVNGRGLIPVARIALRADDTPLLAEVTKRTGIGRLLTPTYPTAHTRTPVASWSVRGADDLTELVQILDQARPRGRRGREYLLWREAVRVYAAGGGGDRTRSVLANLREALGAARAYDPTARYEAAAPSS
jgi:hypothetical protein